MPKERKMQHTTSFFFILRRWMILDTDQFITIGLRACKMGSKVWVVADQGTMTSSIAVLVEMPIDGFEFGAIQEPVTARASNALLFSNRMENVQRLRSISVASNDRQGITRVGMVARWRIGGTDGTGGMRI